MTKAKQLLKTKGIKPKKLSKANDLAFRRAINEISTGLCQLCGNVGHDIHHPLYGCYGANRDMTCAIMICRECHDKCHKDKHGDLNMEAERIGKVNYMEYIR